jgi:hypothetical protein
MSKRTRALVLGATLAAMNLARPDRRRPRPSQPRPRRQGRPTAGHRTPSWETQRHGQVASQEQAAA